VQKANFIFSETLMYRPPINSIKDDRPMVYPTEKFRKSARLLVAIAGLLAFAKAGLAADVKPTIVLVHGAMADNSSWSGVMPLLSKDGYRVIAVADPLRSLSGDASYVNSVVKTIDGPVVLVGHSYGGSVISGAADGVKSVRALVYVAAFAPEKGESAFGLIGKFPGSELGNALAQPILLADGTHDLSIDPAKFASPFAADLSDTQVKAMAATQRPVNEKALKEEAGKAAWKSVPSYFIYGSLDKSIPPALHDFMAKRANAKDIVVVPDASHAILLSHPEKVAAIIEEAAEQSK
jgi:pimeloyl-ACP methyl ester carboxylesterase